MADYLDAEGCLVEVPESARNLVNHLGAIVSALIESTARGPAADVRQMPAALGPASLCRTDLGVREQRIPHERGALQPCLERCEQGSPVAVETIGNWSWIVDEVVEGVLGQGGLLIRCGRGSEEDAGRDRSRRKSRCSRAR